MGSLDFFMRDMYPNYSGLETSTEAVLDASDKQAITTGDGSPDDNEVDHTTNTGNNKSIIFAILLIILVVVFLGSFTK